MLYKTIFFDLDDTLYAHSTGLWTAIRGQMSQYMVERLGLPPDDVPELRRIYFEKYGTTLRGLQIHHQVDPEEYLAYVHDVPLANYLEPCSELRQILLSLPQQRWILTNADSNHALRVLKQLDLVDCFIGIIDILALKYVCKPELFAYQHALILAGNPDPYCCVLIDDKLTNLLPARSLGMATVLVSENGTSNDNNYRCVTSLLELPTAMPELWLKD